MQGFAGTDTIVAIATPPGSGGIGMVRISGPGALAVLEGIWLGRPHPSKFESRKLYLGAIDLPGRGSAATGSSAGGPITDRVMAVYMPAPKTYTGEDVVEISCHGSQVILSRIVSGCVAAGARVAEPGEFTRRAFLAGKMDLAQAEAVCDLICAQGERAARLAAEQLDGKLSSEVGSLSNEIADARAVVEASLDFPDEGIEAPVDFAARLAAIEGRVGRLAATYGRGRLIREGVRVAIIGRPNAGKSSLLNRLVGCERALVHHEPGTTRDVVEECASISGMTFRFRDTAGIRGAPSEVEALGVDRSRQEVEGADIVLVVFDGSREFGPEDAEVLGVAGRKGCVCVINKSDLPQRFDMEELDVEPARASALSGEGIDGITARLSWLALSDERGLVSCEGATVGSARHAALLAESRDALGRAMASIANGEPLEIAAQFLRQAQDALGGVTGEVTDDEILGRIFSRFCIGK